MVLVWWLVRMFFEHESVIVRKRFFEHGMLSSVIYMKTEVEGITKLSLKHIEASSYVYRWLT